MTVFEKIKSIKGKVTYMLETYPELRDDDNLLVARIIFLQIGPDVMKLITPQELLEKFARKEVTSPSTIERARRLIQEKNEHLRGENYIARHKEATDVRNNIKSI